MRIWRELKPDQALFLAVVLKVKGIRDRAQHSASLLIVVLTTLDVSGERGGIGKKLAHASFVLLAQLRSEWLPVPQDRTGDLALPGLNHVAIVIVFFVFAMKVIAPVRVVLVLLRQFVLN